MHRSSPYSRTKPDRRRLSAAVAGSLALHLLPLLPALIRPAVPTPPPAPPPLLAELRPPVPPLRLPAPIAETEPTPPPPPKMSPPRKAPPADRPGQAAPTWTQTVKRHLQKLDQAGLFYPPEAIAQGLQGEAEILLILDEAGQVVGARVEHGSGYAILDQAALRAVRSLTSLPADAPRQVVLPVRFRLR